MTPKARDLQEPGQHDMIEALRDALHQDNSEELNPRMRDALKSFRERLHAHPYVRSLEKHRSSTRSLRRRPFAPARLALAAAGVAAIVAIGIVLTMTPRVDIIAQAIAATADIKTAHGVRTDQLGTYDESWYSREHGLRAEGPNGIHVYTSEGMWDYWRGDNNVVIQEANAEILQKHQLFYQGVTLLQALSEEKTPYQQSDDTLDGMPMTRIDFEVLVDEKKGALTIWIDKSTGFVAAVDEGGSRHNARQRYEYNMPLDPALFTFEIPEGATVEDLRGTTEPQEGSQ